jgi:3-phosphoshikimate 1-carboxyvinyltransferase
MSRISAIANELNEGITIPLPGSKSESNRALLINALSNAPGQISNLAIARDTDIMQNLLSSDGDVFDAQDAGTVMRFMTAYLATLGKETIITGSSRMKKRPIKILVDALRELGVTIDYLEESGYPPLKINSLREQKKNTLVVPGNISSQYISALLMIAPQLPQGLTLKLEGEVVSKPYIELTMAIMRHFGVDVNVSGQRYEVARQSYSYAPFTVEADWSGASYWYAIFALSSLESLSISGLREHSFQGDSVLKELMEGFGVRTEFIGDKAVLTRKDTDLPASIDFVTCPDLAQTFAVLCAAMGHSCTFFGLQTLKIKETDRVSALQKELGKFGGDFTESGEKWLVKPISWENWDTKSIVNIDTYDDHRMAMAFAPLALKTVLCFDDANVVNKSYPSFWNDLTSLGYLIKNLKN